MRPITREPSAPIYYFCHGVPGSPADAELVVDGLPNGAKLLTPNLFEATKVGSELGKAVTAQFDEMVPDNDAPVYVIGFSIGAMAACHLAANRPDRVKRLSLISPAAPLQMGEFLPQMAGAPVFKMAEKLPLVFAGATMLQGLILWMFPGFLIKTLFAKSGWQEKELLKEASFRQAMKQSLDNSYRRYPWDYRRIVKAYVRDWSGVLEQIKCPVDLWHGTKDSWAPMEMSQALIEAIPSECELHKIKDGEHYSTLAKYCVDG